MQSVKITWKQYNKDIREVAKFIKSIEPEYIYGIPRGGLVAAVHLSNLTGVPLIIHPTKLPPSTLIVDDVSDTGKTLSPYKGAGYKIVTLYRKDNTITEPNFCCRTINKWIIYPWEI